MATKKKAKKKTAKKVAKKKTAAKKVTKKKTAKKVTKKKTAKKVTKKKTAAKKVTKKTTAKKATAKKTATKTGTGAPIKAGAKPRTKSQIMSDIAAKRGMTRKDVVGIFEDIEELIAVELKKHKKLNFLGLIKMTEKKKPARKARKGVNPFTGEEMTFKAKPASKTVKATALKKLKEMI